jgi:hypothetical protein
LSLFESAVFRQLSRCWTVTPVLPRFPAHET